MNLKLKRGTYDRAATEYITPPHIYIVFPLFVSRPCKNKNGCKLTQQNNKKLLLYVIVPKQQTKTFFFFCQLQSSTLIQAKAEEGGEPDTHDSSGSARVGPRHPIIWKSYKKTPTRTQHKQCYRKRLLLLQVRHTPTPYPSTRAKENCTRSTGREQLLAHTSTKPCIWAETKTTTGWMDAWRGRVRTPSLRI